MDETLQWSGRALAAAFMIAGTFHASSVAARRLLPHASPALRWTATASVGMALLTAGFHILFACGLLEFWPAIGLSGLVWAAALLTGDREAADSPGLVDDLRRVLTPASAGRVTIAGLATVLLVRAVSVPVLGWDSLTYHAVKAAMWVQTGGPIGFDAPGGWSIYRSYLAGGEVFHALAMLPFHGDLLVGVVDALQWLFLGIGVYALGEQLELPDRLRTVAVASFLSVPAVLRAVGSLYVDNALALALIVALVLALDAVRYGHLRSLFLCWLSLGVASGIKVFALPVAVLMSVAATALSIPHLRRSNVGWLAAGIVCGPALAAPWFVHNWRMTGYPLSPLPIRLLGWQLGESNAALGWYMNRPELASLGWRDELRGLAQLFGLPGFVAAGEPTLGFFSILPWLILPAALYGLTRRDWRVALLALTVVVPIVGSYFGPDMKLTRMLFAAVNARYLVGAAGIVIVVGLSGLVDRPRAGRVYVGLLWLGVLIHVAVSGVAGWTSSEMSIVLPASVVLLALALYFARRTWRLPRVTGVAVCLISLIAGFGLLDFVRESRRAAWLETSVVLHPIQKYWLGGLATIDEPERGRTLAVTAGSQQNNDNWFLYHFLGRRLQNRLVYVPVTTGGETIDLAQSRLRAASADYRAWLGRLRELGVSEVVSFAPASLELFWMERHPEFTRLAGDADHWGVYRVEP